MAWTYSDYVTYDYGDDRLTRFRAHVQEVSEEIARERSGKGRSVASQALQKYLDTLLDREPAEIHNSKAAGQNTSTFTRLRPYL